MDDRKDYEPYGDGLDEKLFERAKALMLLQDEACRWNRQSRYPGPFVEMRRPMRDSDIRAHLEGRNWIACRLPAHGRTDRIILDLDCESEQEIAGRDARYWAMRRLFGEDAVPLVWSTPSQLGLRVAYRIPFTAMEDLASSAETGLLPDVLRAVGLEPKLGTVEIFPASWRCDRQLFGRRMPLRNPETLEPVVGADLDDRFSAAKLDRAVELAEAWFQVVHHDLVAHLQALPRCGKPVDMPSGGPEPAIDPAHGIAAPPATARLIHEGLGAPHSRYRTEFAIGKAMWLWPELFEDLGLPPNPDREDVAYGLARWVAARTNGHSKEWSASLRRRGLDGAKREWAKRYLRRNRSDGRAPVDRMRRAAAAEVPGMWPTVHLTPDERDRIRHAVRRARWYDGLVGAELYRFEVWASTCIRVAKSQMRRGGVSGDRAAATAQIAAAWMQDWPWGKRYVEYRGLLVQAGLVRKVEDHQWSKVSDVPGKATTYAFTEPDWIRRRDLPMDPDVVAERIASLQVHGRPATLDEAYHALYLDDSGIDIERQYGRRTRERVGSFVRALRPPSPLTGC